MYRVELKEDSGATQHSIQAVLGVPNVPCGVESLKAGSLSTTSGLFLMYRVEFKGYLAMGRS